MLNSVWCPYGEDETGAALYPRQDDYGFGQEQLTWVAQVGLRFEEPGWALVVMTHVPVHTGCDGKFRDRELLTGMLHAFATGGTYQGVYRGRNGGTGGAIAPGFTNLADPSSSDWKRDCRVSSSGAETAAAGDHHQLHPRLSGPDASHPGPGFVQRRAQWGKIWQNPFLR